MWINEKEVRFNGSFETQVQITETGAIVTTSSALFNKKLAETDTQVKLERPNAMQAANFVHMLKVEDSQQLKVRLEYLICYTLRIYLFFDSLSNLF